MSENNLERKKKVVEHFLKKGVLLSSDIVEKINDPQQLDSIYNDITKKEGSGLLVLDQESGKLSKQGKGDINWVELEKTKTLSEKGNTKPYEKFKTLVTTENRIVSEVDTSAEHLGVSVKNHYKLNSTKKTLDDFVDHFNKRHNQIEKILSQRVELRSLSSINKILARKGKGDVSFIGTVSEIKYTKNKNLVVVLEDSTGQIRAIVSKGRKDIFAHAKELVLDEVVGIVGASTEDIVFVNKIIWPDVPAGSEIKRSKKEEFIAFISDIHVGSAQFLPEDFDRFLNWTNGGVGSEGQKHVAKNLKYIVVSGDLVDGVGIYPGQDEELAIKDIYQQYVECAKLLAKIPQHIQIIICFGNHDAMRLGEPQPVLRAGFAKPFLELPNVILVSNPATVNLGATSDFSGFDVLMYHGASFDHYVREVESLRNKGGYDRADLIMEFLLKRRHLAPTHTSAPYVPSGDDFLVIDSVPDFLVSGHIHKSIVANYRKVTLVCGSCWQSKTSFQEKVGHNPEPSRVPVVNTKTRAVKILKFGKG